MFATASSCVCACVLEQSSSGCGIYIRNVETKTNVVIRQKHEELAAKFDARAATPRTINRAIYTLAVYCLRCRREFSLRQNVYTEEMSFFDTYAREISGLHE